MTIEQAKKLIPWIDERLLHQNPAPQTYPEIKEKMMQAVNDKRLYWQLEKFAACFSARSEIGQKIRLKDLHQFVYDNFAYKQDGFQTQQILQPAICFYHRQKGVDCKDRSNFVQSVARQLGLKCSIVFLLFKPQKIKNIIYVHGHVYPKIWVNNTPFILDTTIPDFNQEYVGKKIIHKEEIVCY